MAHEGEVFEGKTLDAAVRKGLDTLGLSRAEVMITILEEGSGGFLGLGARPYRVRVMRRPGGPPPAEPDEERRRRREGREGRDRRDRHGRDERRGREGRRDQERRGQPGAPAGGPRRDERARDERRRDQPSTGGPRRDDRTRDDHRRDDRTRDDRRRDPSSMGAPRRDERRRDDSRDERRRDQPSMGGPRRESSSMGPPRRDERPREERSREERPREEGAREERARDASSMGAPRREPVPPEAQEQRPGFEDGGSEVAGAPGEGRRRRRRGRRGGRRRHGAGQFPEGAALAPGGYPAGEPVTGPYEAEEAVEDTFEAPADEPVRTFGEPAAELGRPAEELEEPEELEEREEEEMDEAEEEPREMAVEPRRAPPEPPRREPSSRGAPRREERRREPREHREHGEHGGEAAAVAPEELAAQARRVTEDLLKAMGFEATVGATADGNHVEVTAEVAQDEDLLTGRKGEVRQALQHLLNRMLNRGESSRFHLQLEINDFWKRREEELRELARGLADEAVRSGGEVVTEYLNAQERRIVHVTLREDTRVKTYALGTGMIKRVAIAPAGFEGGPRDEGE